MRPSLLYRCLLPAGMLLAGLQAARVDDPVAEAVREMRAEGLAPDLEGLTRPQRERFARIDPDAYMAAVEGIRKACRFDGMEFYSHQFTRAGKQAWLDMAEAVEESKTIFATAVSEGVFPVDWNLEQPFLTGLPHLAPARSLTQLGNSLFIISTAIGDPDRAMQEWRFIDDLIEACQHDHLIISHLVGIACETIRSRGLEIVSENGKLAVFSADQIREFSDIADAEAAVRASYKQSLLGEMAAQAVTFDNPSTKVINLLLELDEENPPGHTWDIPEEALEHLRSAEGRQEAAELINAGRWHLPQGDFDFYQIDYGNEPTSPQGFTRISWWMFLPPYQKLFRATASTIAVLRVRRTAMATELYRRKYGDAPSNLEALVPEFLDAVPVDPFDGRPLRYRVGDVVIPWRVGGDETAETVRAARIYSIGPNLIDEDGIRAEMNSDGDVVFFLGLP